ncbi:hypothetical protein ACFX2B_027737 [Malus domestica]
MPATSGPTVTPVLGEVTPSVGKNLPKNPKQSAIILEEDDEGDKIPPATHLRPIEPPSIDIPPAVEVTDQVNSLAADRGKKPIVEPEATLETPVYPQDQDLGISFQEATSAFSSWEVEFDALLSSTLGMAGPSAATTKLAESTDLVRLQELLSLSAS